MTDPFPRKNVLISKPPEEQGIKEQISNLAPGPSKSLGMTLPKSFSANETTVFSVPSSWKSQSPPVTSQAQKEQTQPPIGLIQNLPEINRSKSDDFRLKPPQADLKVGPLSSMPESTRAQENLKEGRTDTLKESSNKEDVSLKPETVAPPQLTDEAERASSSFAQMPSFDEKELQEYIDSALSYLKETEEKMLEKFKEARNKLYEIHPTEKINYAYDKTKEKLSSVASTAAEDVGIAKHEAVHVYEKAKDIILNIAEKVNESAKHNYEFVKEKFGKITHKASEEYDVAKEKVGDISHKAKELYESAKNKVESVSEEVIEKTKIILMSPTDELNEIADRIRHDRELELLRQRQEREKFESVEEERERDKLLKQEDDITRIKLLESEAPQSLPK